MIIRNNGPHITATDYWQTPHGRGGLIYVSVNAGAFRLLVPDAAAQYLPEMRTAQYVVITCGVWDAGDGRLHQDALQFLFEDGSNSPFAIYVLRGQVDRLLPAADEGRADLSCLVYTPGGLAMDLPAWYCRAAHLS